MEGGGAAGVDLSRKFVSESELDEKRKKRQEEWEKVRKPDDPEGKCVRTVPNEKSSMNLNLWYALVHVSFVSSSEAPEEKYDPRSLFERLQEQKDKKQEDFEEQFKFSECLSLFLCFNCHFSNATIPRQRASGYVFKTINSNVKDLVSAAPIRTHCSNSF